MSGVLQMVLGGTVRVFSSVEVLIQAGGGGGGCSNDVAGGGGGAGGQIYGATVPVSKGTTYTLTVGGGGAGGVISGSNASSGSNSSGFGGTANGGGFGAGGVRSSPGTPLYSANGGNGGCGGGNGTFPFSGTAGTSTQTSPTNFTGYGFAGTSLAGGGTAEAGGTDGPYLPGDGRYYSQFTGYGSPAGYIGGGGTIGLVADKSDGGGGYAVEDPNSSNRYGSNGIANTGGGGGAGYTDGSSAKNGGSGGSGIILIRYADAFPLATSTTGSPTVTTSGGFRIYAFTGSGSITW